MCWLFLWSIVTKVPHDWTLPHMYSLRHCDGTWQRWQYIWRDIVIIHIRERNKRNKTAPSALRRHTVPACETLLRHKCIYSYTLSILSTSAPTGHVGSRRAPNGPARARAQLYFFPASLVGARAICYYREIVIRDSATERGGDARRSLHARTGAEIKAGFMASCGCGGEASERVSVGYGCATP